MPSWAPTRWMSSETPSCLCPASRRPTGPSFTRSTANRRGRPAGRNGIAVKDSTRLVALGSPTGVGVIAATTLASAVATLDANAVKADVPGIRRDLGASISALHWALTSHLLTVAVLLLSGALADRFG